MGAGPRSGLSAQTERSLRNFDIGRFYVCVGSPGARALGIEEVRSPWPTPG